MTQNSQQEITKPTTEPNQDDLNTAPDWTAIKNALRAPFEMHQVSVVCVARTKTKDSGLAAAYVDSRAYEERLDDVLGFENWQSHYEPWGDNQLICHLTLLGVTKSDVGEADPKDGNTATSAKAKAFKRASSCFGLGRYLYELPKVWGDMDSQGKQFQNPEALVRQIHIKANIIPESSSNGAKPPTAARTQPVAQKAAPAAKDESLTSATPAEERDGRGAAIARSGWVEKSSDGFIITMRDVADKVWATLSVSKNDNRETICDCDGFKKGSAKEGPRFKCEHIYAVVHFLKQTQTEAGEKAAATADASASTYQGDPLGTTTGNLINSERHGLIRAISKGAKLDAGAECQRLLSCKVEDLSRDAADWFIEQLKGLASKPPTEPGAPEPTSESTVSVSMSDSWNCTPATQRKLIHHWELIVAHPRGMGDEEMRETFQSQYDDKGAPESLDEKTAASAELRLKVFLDALKLQADQDESKPTTARHSRR